MLMLMTPPEAEIVARSKKAPATLSSFIANLFKIELREAFDAETGGDRADVEYTWGM